jgi:hypothetical protein
MHRVGAYDLPTTKKSIYFWNLYLKQRVRRQGGIAEEEEVMGPASIFGRTSAY